MSHAYSRGDERTKAQAARSRKGVVGNSGRNIPATPSDSDTTPNTANRAPKPRKFAIFVTVGRFIYGSRAAARKKTYR